VRWDFRKRRVRPTHYTIKSDSLKSWAIHGSLDGDNWTQIDQQTDDNHLQNRSHQASFPIAESDRYRYIRLSQIGPNHSGTDQLIVEAFELFGTLIEDEPQVSPRECLLL
jgi:hypothetical protein